MMRLNHFFVATFFVSVLSFSAHASVVAHWKFEEGPAGSAASGTGSLLDASGNNLSMTPFGGPKYEVVANPGSILGLDFDGTNDIAYRADSSLFKLTSLTVEAFIRLDASLSSLHQIIFRGDYRSGKDPFYLAVLGGKLRFYLDDLTSAVALHSPDVLPLGTNLHVAATLDDATDTMKMFINGVEVASMSASGIRPNVDLFSSARVSIGGLSDGFGIGQYFGGGIDEVRISDTALSPSGFLTRPVPEPSALIVWALLGSIGLVATHWRRG